MCTDERQRFDVEPTSSARDGRSPGEREAVQTQDAGRSRHAETVENVGDGTVSSGQSAFPVESNAEVDASPVVQSIDEAGDVFEALRSETARTLAGRVGNAPATASDLARATDTSLQNVQYHLERLQAAGVVEVVDTAYSERGREMSVYARTNDPLVIVSGEDQEDPALGEVIARCR